MNLLIFISKLRDVDFSDLPVQKYQLGCETLK